MNLRLIQLFSLVLFTVFSTVTSAGEGCSKNKAHQELSADALKNLDKNHFWSKFYDHHQPGKSLGHGNNMIEKIDTKVTSGLIES